MLKIQGLDPHFEHGRLFALQVELRPSGPLDAKKKVTAAASIAHVDSWKRYLAVGLRMHELSRFF